MEYLPIAYNIFVSLMGVLVSKLLFLQFKFTDVKLGKLKSPYNLSLKYFATNYLTPQNGLEHVFERISHIQYAAQIFKRYQDEEVLATLSRKFRKGLLLVLVAIVFVFSALLIFAGQIIPMLVIAIIGSLVIVVGIFS